MSADFPVVHGEPADRYRPFDLTDTQLAYVLGRSDAFDFGGVAAHGYYEYEGPIDPARLTEAWNLLIRRHDALRLIVDTERREQRVLASVPRFEPVLHDLRALTAADRADRLDELRQQYSHLVADPGTWPLFHLAVSLLDENTVRLHIGFDGLCFDYLSWRLLLAELTELYRDPDHPLPELTLTFRDYVRALTEFENTDLYRRSERYWLDRVPDFPAAPQLPAGDGTTETRFTRREAGLAPARWQALARRGRGHGLTPSALMAAVFAEVVATWSGQDCFALNIPSMNRMPLHPQVETVIGEFASLCALEIRHDRDVSFLARAKQIQASLWQGLEHSHYSALRFMRELVRYDSGPERARMPIVLTSTLGWSDGARMPFDGAVREVYALSQTPQVSLDVQIHEHDGELYYNWDTVDSAFAPGVIDTMFTAFHELLERLADATEPWELADLELVPRQSAELTGPDRELPATTVSALFAERAAAQPDHPAVIDGDRTVGYRELFDTAARIAGRLQADGTPPLVVLALGKGQHQIAAVHGVLLAGAAYLPLDIEQPTHRLAAILADSGATCALVDTTTPAPVRDHLETITGLRTIDLDSDAVAAAEPVAAEPSVDGTALAYVLYTSGSTGAPKGVMVEHAGILNCVLETIDTYGIGPGDRSLAVSALHHDMSGFDVFVALAAGATVVLPSGVHGRDPGHWRDLVTEHAVTLWCSVPAMADMLDAAGGGTLTTLRLMLCGGDRIDPALVQRLRRTCPNTRFVSIGGPTETTLWNIWHEVDSAAPVPDPIPYGRPLANTRYLVLDSAGRPAPQGVTGELYCAGPGVARGYLGRPELTDAAFTTLPETGERIYRTGDFGRVDSAGRIEFAGRRDRQIKVRGHRVELGEIESALTRIPGVATAAVTPPGSAAGPRTLAAYITGRDLPGPEDIRRRLGETLPAHMVPAAVHILDTLPLTVNGKVDYRALNARTGAPATVPAGPVTDLDRVLVALWRDLLEVAEIGPGDNFYALGGNSVVAVEITREMREVFDDPDIDLNLVLSTPTLGELAHALRVREPEPQRLDRVARIYLEILELSSDAVESELAGRAETAAREGN